MRVNVYAEEMTNKLELVTKTIGGQQFTGLRFYLELPVSHQRLSNGDVLSVGLSQPMRGPFLHGEDDDDSSAVTFWGKRDLREVMHKAIEMLDHYYEARTLTKGPMTSGGIAEKSAEIFWAIKRAAAGMGQGEDILAMASNLFVSIRMFERAATQVSRMRYISDQIKDGSASAQDAQEYRDQNEDAWTVLRKFITGVEVSPEKMPPAAKRMLLIEKAIDVLREHIRPDGPAPDVTLGKLYQLFDGPEFRDVTTTQTKG